jgi:hypothetical protein
MTEVRCRPWLPVTLLALLMLSMPVGADACPFCAPEKSPTLVEDFRQAHFVVLGTFTNYKPNPGDIGGTYDLVIERALKPHDILKGKKVIQTNRGQMSKSKFVVFLDVFEGKPDAYRGVELLPGSDLVEYLTKALELKDKPNPERLRHAFDYLASSDADVAMDAYREFAKADYKDYKDIARKLPADKVAGWLQDPDTPTFRYGLYASLLGHCGDPQKHGKLLRAMCDDPEKRRGSGIDGLFAAYVMLRPQEGWKYLRGLLNDPKEEFDTRYAALRTARFFWGERTDLVKKDDLVAGVAHLLEHDDIADFAIEDLRKWQRWELCDRILDLLKRPTHDVAVIRRAALRFALQCPSARATAYVREQRRQDAEYVADTEELLRIETEVLPQVPEPKKQ